MASSSGGLTMTGSSTEVSSATTTGGGGGGGRGRGAGPMQAWWEGIAKARECISALKEIMGPVASLEMLQESETPAKDLLDDEEVAHAILAHLIDPSSGHGHDALCQWLYDTFQSGDPDLQAVVLRYVPALCGLYLPRITSLRDESLAGFEAVLLGLYAAETKARNGCSIAVNIPDLSQASLYHAPRISPLSSPDLREGLLSAPLEPQDTVKATKRACIVGVALDLFCRKIAIMPRKAKIEACQCALRLARLSCADDEFMADGSDDGGGSPASVLAERNPELDHQRGSASPSTRMPEIEIVGPGELFSGGKSPSHQDSFQNPTPPSIGVDTGCSPKQSSTMNHASSEQQLATIRTQGLRPCQLAGAAEDFPASLIQAGNGARVPLTWELIQPILRILGHCLMAPSKNCEEVKQAASIAIKALHRRACHDLMPEAMLATRSLRRLETAAKAMSKTHSASENSTSSSTKPRKLEILLVSK